MAGRPVKRARGGAKAEGGKAPEFTPTHGARSPRMVQPLADEIAQQLAVVAPWTNVPSFAATVKAWAWAEAQCVLLRSWIDENGLLDSEGRELPAAGQLDRSESKAAKLRGELGLTPSAWARLVARLGSADGEAASRGISALQAIGAELDQGLRALPAGHGEHDNTQPVPEDRPGVSDSRESHGDGTETTRDGPLP